MNNTINLSSFPTSIDTFERMSDISGKPIADGEQSTLEKSKIYKEIIEAGNYEDAEKYIGKKADKNRKIYNGMMKTYFYQFLGPRPPRQKEGK